MSRPRGNEFSVLKPDFDTDDTFAGLTASNFLAAINDDDGTADYADIVDGSLDAADSPFGDNFVGTVQDHMVFVENDANRGEYKVFYLTSELDADGNVDNDDGDFASATLLGTIDFGATITGDPISEANLWGSNDPTGDGTTSWSNYYLNDVILGEGGEPVDTTPPTLTAVVPADNATNVAVDTDLVLTFSENVQAGTGAIGVRNAADDSLVEAVLVENAEIVGNTVTIDLTADLAPGTDYYVQIQPGAIEDLAGNDFGGVINSTALNFTTAAGSGDTTAPTLLSEVPADDAVDVPVGSNLVLTFSEDVVAGTGSFVIFNGDGTIFETIAAADATIAGDTVTLDPTVDFTAGAAYFVGAQPGAVEDLAGNDFAGITDPTAYNFTAAAGGTGEVDVPVTSANAGETFMASDETIETFTVGTDASYEYIIDNFDIGVDFIEMPAGTTMDNTALDGEATLQWASDGVIVDITLIGLTDAQDTQLATLGGLGDSLIIA